MFYCINVEIVFLYEILCLFFIFSNFISTDISSDQPSKFENVCQNNELYDILSKYYCYFYLQNPHVFQKNMHVLDNSEIYQNMSFLFEHYTSSIMDRSILQMNSFWVNTTDMNNDALGCL